MKITLQNFVFPLAVILSVLSIAQAQQDPLWAEFNGKGGYRAYLAANISIFNGGVNDEQLAFEHWKNHGRGEGRPFDKGRARTDANYLIDGGFSWEYLACGKPHKTVVFITKDAPKPLGWDGRELLLKKGDLFNLGPDYDAAAYRVVNADVAQAIDSGAFPSFASVTDHYVKYGFKEGRLTNKNWQQSQLDSWIDNAYFTQNPDVRDFFLGAQGEGWKPFGKIGFAHYVNFGETEGRSTGQVLTAAQEELARKRGFDGAAYLARDPGLASAIQSGFYKSARDHFDEVGKCEFAIGNLNRRPNDFFDNAFYLSAYPDVASAVNAGIFATAWDHWRVAGAKEGRAGLPAEVGFDQNYYLARYPEVASLIGAGKQYPTALFHYLAVGQKERRNPNAFFDETFYVNYYQLQDAISKGLISSGHEHYQRFGKSTNNRTYRSLNGVLTVGSGANEYPTIQDAINAAQNGEEIRVPAGTYSAFGVFDKTLTITGAGRETTFLQPGTKSDPAVKENTGGGIAAVIGSTANLPVVTIKGFTFRGGDNSLNSASYKEGKSGALTVRGAKVLISECDFRQNTALTGGAIIFENSSGSEVVNCRFIGNSAQRDGGAIAAFKNGLARVANSIFEDNVVETLREINGQIVATGYNYVHDGNSGVHRTAGFRGYGVSYPANSPARDGEFYDRDDTGPFRLSFDKVFGPAFFGYYAGPLGGAIALNQSSPLISGCEFRRNRANFAGGAIYMIERAAPTIDGNYFEANQSSRGGAIYSESGNVTASITNNKLIANKSPADPNFPGSGKGGGIALYYLSAPLIQGNEFRDNSAGYGGGAIGIYEDSNATIRQNQFIGNIAQANNLSGSIPASDGKTTLLEFGIGAGGAIDVEVGNATIEGNNLNNNTARLGGGIFVVGTASISGNTVGNSRAISGAVGTFPGDTGLIGSGIYLANPSGNASTLKASVFNNTLSSGNFPNDIVMSTGGTAADLPKIYNVNQPGARIQKFPPN